ncbi:kinase-like protein [Viridothelium virens]|uniref:Kinase-like protein n=1 Tax=Viridothelium virens TaxID=1048519 RepID=A0A6A6HD70_VIRVR|nr:kinase-like protein [Viridothelium virens]
MSSFSISEADKIAASNGQVTIGNSETMELREALKKRLRKERIECPQFSQQHFIPWPAQKKLITEDTIRKVIIAEHPHLNHNEVKQYVQRTFQKASTLFAILAYMKSPQEICGLLDEGITDEQLPLRRKTHGLEGKALASQWILEARPGDGKTAARIKLINDWQPDQREKFSKAQRLMTAPVFQRNVRLPLDDDVVLPFMYPEGNKKRPETRGGYSEIQIRRPYEWHHDFWDCLDDANEERLVAIKKLLTTDDREINNEIENLQRVGGKHDHLMELFAYFEYKDRMHLILPYADADLRQYWEENPSPNFNAGTVLWSVEQMHGIADGLLKVHEFTPSWPPEPKEDARKQPELDANIQIQSGEKIYGRHGDFKPENILWFSSGPDGGGMLKIADYGLCRFHGRESRSQSNPHHIAYSFTYEPPEIRLGKCVSRAYDFWSLGCVYLEFITWLMQGNIGIEAFSDARMAPHNTIPRLSEDIFFTMIKSGDEPQAEVRKAVVEWVQDLHKHERCSLLVHDLLDLIMNDMLCIDPDTRIKAMDLRDSLKGFLNRAKEDNHYLLAPTPNAPRRTPVPKRTPVVRFEEQDHTGSSSI